MRRFYMEFLLTTLVFAHVLFGVIWFRARSRLREVEQVAAKENRERLAKIGVTAPRGVPPEESEEIPEPAVEIPVEVIFERIAKARKNNDLSGIEREIADLVAAGGRAVPLLQERFKSSLSDNEKIIIALALARIFLLSGAERDEFFEKFVLPYLKDVFARLTDYQDIARAFQAAAAYGTDEALKWIAERFTSAERGDVKKAALRALADAESDLAEDILFDLLENAKDYTDRRRVVGVFLENPSPENIERIKEMLEKEPPPSVATRILLAGLLGAMYRQGADGDGTDFNAFAEREVPFLTDMVNSKRTDALRRDALQSLINIWTDDAQAVVSRVLSDEGQRVELRILAGKALASHGQISALEPLQKMLDSGNPRARVGAVEAILILKAETGDPNVEAVLDEKAVAVLKAMLLKRETAYARNAATALAAIGSTKARDALIEIMNTAPANPAIIQTIRALGAFADAEAAAALEDYASKEYISPALRKAASETLARIRNELKRKNH
ncbi:MAG: hypothetical protein E3J72_15825 [Planctomycetota bacterium]|nr:MAG: hypothetical protein E3J72_15825 [Planctomycetota bacterium]